MEIKNIIPKILSYKATVTFFVLFVSSLIFTLSTPDHVFVDPRNVGALGKLIPDLGIVALGVGMLMICGEFDLSVGSVLPFCAYVFIMLLQTDMNLFFIPFVVLGAGALLGLVNALITVKGKIPSFIATLGMMMFWRGILYVHSKMWPIPVRPYLPAGSSFEDIFTAEIGGLLPVQAVWFAAFGLILGVLLYFHKFGNWVYATGDNEEAARAMGINTDRVKAICFVVVGALCAFVAIAQTLRLESFCCTQGLGFELKAIASSVVGGTSLMGGVGSMAGIFLGALTIQILENGLILMGVPVFGISAFVGLITISFVLVNAFVERRRMMIV